MKTKYRILTLQFLMAMICTTISAQEILNVTRFSTYGPEGLQLQRDIHLMDGKIIVPLVGSYNSVYENMPLVEVDSFDVPKQGSFDVNSTLYAEYEPGQGFIKTDIANYQDLPNTYISENFIGFSAAKRVSGINNHYFTRYPIDSDTLPIRQIVIAVYDRTEDSIIYEMNIENVPRYDMRNVIAGDFIYVNIPLTSQYDEDLYFMGDTLTYPFNIYGNQRNYLSKINFKTGEKEWTHMIGYGEVGQMMVDDLGNINLDIKTPGPPSIDDEVIGNIEDWPAGWYDRLIYRISPSAEPLGHVIVHTQSVPTLMRLEFNQDGSFQVFGDTEIPIHLVIQGDSLDLTGATESNTTGYIAVFDKDLKHKWSKRIKTPMRTVIKTVNRTPSGEYVVGCYTQGYSIEIDDFTYHSPSPVGPVDIFKYIGGLVKFDKDGIIKGTPFFATTYCGFEDVVCISDDHFLILVTSYQSFIPPLQWFNDEFYVSTSSVFLEYKGDLFESITAVNDLFTSSSLNVYPNPCKIGHQLTINMANEVQSNEPYKVTVYSYDGKLEYSTDIVADSKNIVIPTVNLRPGAKVVAVQSGESIFKQSIIIY